MKKSIRDRMIPLFLAAMMVFLLPGCSDESSSSGEVVEPIAVVEEATAEPVATETPVPTKAPVATEAPSPTPEATPEPTISADDNFQIHYLDVGQADAALVLCGEQAMLIDGGNKDDSSLMYAYLQKQGIDHLDYMVCTHPHEDHGGGLPGALNYASVDVAFAPMASYDNDIFLDYQKYLTEQGISITVPTPGETYSLGNAEFEILGPITQSDDLNDMSIVLKLQYGDTSFLFTGDCEKEEEADILKAGYDLSSTVLKVGHHGGDTSTTEQFLKAVMPEYSVISCGMDNAFGHPTAKVLGRLGDVNTKVYRTDLQGNITCYSDGISVRFEVEKNPDADTMATPAPAATPTPEPTAVAATEGASSTEKSGQDYVLNTNSYKFHRPGCSSVSDMAEYNKKEYHGTRDEVIAMGYSPCGRCHP